MFIILLTYTCTNNKIDEYLVDHRSYLDRYYSQNKFICSGAQQPRNGGVILCNGVSKEEVESIILEDPFNIHALATYQIIEFTPSKFAPAFESFIQEVKS